MAFRFFLISSFVFAVLGLTGCSKAPVSSSSARPSPQPAAAPGLSMLQLLELQSRQWQGVPHRDGGLSHKGIDCSGLVFVTYRDTFATTVPRSTKALASHGRQIQRNQLAPGDLVFFKTGWGKRHVGIYLDNSRFLHASKSKGVMVSSLTNPYWQQSYWQSRRVLD